MIERIIHFSVKNKILIGIFITALIGWGIYSLTRLPVDAIPDITNNQVQIISIAPSLAVQEVESFVTAPLEVAVASIPDIVELRSISRLGLSVITVVFKDHVDLYWARQQLTERLNEAKEVIPEGIAKTELAPISTGLGEIYQYRLVVDKGLEEKYPPMELRTLQDWVVRRQMLGTPGVADINSYGGYVKQYEVAVNPDKMRSMGITLSDVFTALEDNNENTGSAYIDKKPNAYFIRGIGLVQSLEDIENILIKKTASGFPVLIRDIATVQYGNATRYGAFVVDTSEAVGGVVMMLKGANAHQVIDDVEKRIKTIQTSLPDGVTIEPFLNRSDLVGRAIGTVTENLVLGALIVIFVLVLLLGNLRAGLIVASVIPLSMLFAVSLMNLFGVSGNLMSLGAIDFGIIIDGAVIIVESVVHRIASGKRESGIIEMNQSQMDQSVLDSAKRMMNSATFGQVIILIVYLPIMALTGIEGKMFRPMAQVVTFALIGAVILSLTYVPMASALFLNKKTQHKPNISDKIIDKLHQVFHPAIQFALDHRIAVSISAILLFLLSLFTFTRMGGEFIPQLEEGDLAAGVMTLQGGSLSNTIEQVEKANKIMLDNFPEIKHTVCKIGAGEIPTDPTPMETGDYIITLKPRNEWVSARNREDLVAQIEEKLIPLAGVKFEFQQPIQMRFNELMTGSKQDVAIKLFGDDLQTLSDVAAEIEGIITEIEGVEDINVEKVTGLSQIQVQFNRQRMAQYGLAVKDVNHILRSAIAGSEAGTVFDEEKRFSLVVRLDKDYRQQTEDIENLYIALPEGGQISFGQIADIAIKSGPAQVSRENTKRRITVGFNVRNADVQTVIAEVSRKVSQIELPTGYFITYGGQFENLEAAKARLKIAVPIALLLIFILLYFTFHSVKQALLIFTAVPLAAIGGVYALWIRDMNFSISAGVGFIALFGVAVLNGIVLIAEFNRLEKEGIADIKERVLKGLHARLRPVIMTAAVASLGFLPMAVSGSAGAEVQRPLATVVIGGLFTATLLTLFVLPVFYVIFSNISFRKIFFSKNIKTGIVLVFMVFGASGAFAQTKPLNVQEAIQMALDNNLKVKSAAYEVDAQKSMKGSAWDIPKTDIDGSYGQMNSFLHDNSITVSQSFEFPTVYIHQNKLAHTNITSSEWQYHASQLEIATEVKTIYWHLVFLSSQKSLLTYHDSLMSQFLRSAERKSAVGESNRLELLQARSISMEVKNALHEIEKDVRIDQNKLKVLLNTDDLIAISDQELRPLDVSFMSDSTFISSNPQMAYMQKQAEIAELEKKIERGKALPDLRVGYFSQTIRGEQEVNGVPRAFGPGDRFTGVEAGISIPLWPFPHTSRIKAAGIRQKIADANVVDFNNTLVGKYKELQLEYEKNSASVAYYRDHAIPEADAIIFQAEMSYKAGALDYNDYMMLISRAITIKNNYLGILNTYNQTVIQIDFLTGKIF